MSCYGKYAIGGASSHIVVMFTCLSIFLYNVSFDKKTRYDLLILFSKASKSIILIEFLFSIISTTFHNPVKTKQDSLLAL